MAFLEHSFTADELPQGNNNFDVLPAGWYSATIAKAELKNTKAGTGQYIAVQYNITGPSFQGRVVFGNLNIRNPNPKAEEIGRQQLGDLMRSIGLAKVSDTDQLIGGNLQIKVKVTKSDEYGDGNDVGGFKAIGGAMPSMPSSAPSSTPAASSKAAPPWQK